MRSRAHIRSLFLLAAVALSVGAFARPNQEQPGKHYETAVDSRYNHNRSYPVNGYVYHALPAGYATVHYHNYPYYYHGGVWYRPYGPQFVVVAPVVGLYVPFLPSFYTTVWFGGIPYYYADSVYYAYRPNRGYEVVDPPGGAAAQGSTTAPGK